MTDQPPPDQPAVNLGEQLGLGPLWQPAAAAWELQPLIAADGSQAYVLILRTASGSMGAAISADNLRELLRQTNDLLAAAGPAIVVPPQGLVLPVNGNVANRQARRHPGRR